MRSLSDGILGVAIGDALGVPFEFKSREELQRFPAKDMIAYGTHRQPLGTWSDDASLTFCLAESLCKSYDLADIARNFVRWKRQNYWAARGEVFDIGITTSQAISRLQTLLEKEDFQAIAELKNTEIVSENGNGSLMRILPLLYLCQGKKIAEQYEYIREVSALTHRHSRASMACLIYLRFAQALCTGLSKAEAYPQVQQEIKAFWEEIQYSTAESTHFQRLILADISTLSYKEIPSGGYVIESMEAAFFCFLKENTFENTLLAAVNLGLDTDTNAAIAGGLAGIYYGRENMPSYWMSCLARQEDILDLLERLEAKYILC